MAEQPIKDGIVQSAVKKRYSNKEEPSARFADLILVQEGEHSVVGADAIILWQLARYCRSKPRKGRLMVMLYEIALGLIALILVVSFILYCDALVIVYHRRSSPNFSSFFFRMWWNQCFLDLFMLLFFTTTVYTRCFEVVAPLFLYLNSYPIWTKFAMITQEQIMYIQSTNVLLAVCVRLLAICAPVSKTLKAIEQLSKWKILIIQVALPTVIAIPFYSTYDFRYGLNDYHIPLRIMATNISYEKCIFAIGLFYRTTSMVICLCGYFLLFLHLHRERTNGRSS